MRGDRREADRRFSGDWQALVKLVPFFMEFPLRVFLAMGFLIAAKVATVLLPIAMKHIVDSLDSSANPVLVVPLALVLGYGALRLATIIFGEIRDTIFGRVTERAMRRIGLKVFKHLHQLELAFHLQRRTGGLARDIDRGTNGISFLMRFMLFNILPTLLEIGLVAIILAVNFSWEYPLIVFVAVVIYIAFSVVATEWRTGFVREMNAADNQANTRAIDSLLNFETVKVFASAPFEAAEYDRNLASWEQARRHNRLSLAALNIGQAFVVSGSMTAIMLLAASGVANGDLTLGDLVMVNAYMMQLFIPLNFLGFVYREIKRALADVEAVFELLRQPPAITDIDDAPPLNITEGAVRFENLAFRYVEDRALLNNFSLELKPGQKLAVVGPSGSGKSTLVRLLFRLYEPDAGRILIDGQDIREVTQQSLREQIGVVPQDTVLFNNTIAYNIGYGVPEASMDEIRQAAAAANLTSFIDQLPDGFETQVGERGLKVSGGEKQRIAIARMLLKQPPIMVFDEATSALDSASERAIMGALDDLAANRTTLMIAHRLATVVNADQIVVMRDGHVVEQGSHQQLIAADGQYAAMWTLQSEQQVPESV
ncbi:MAG: ABC transporter ATP-binding protein/permease [Pseudomonadota bacterium]